MSEMTLGTNVVGILEGTVLTLRIDLAARHGKSASGKSVIVATTAGNLLVPGTSVQLGVNAYVKV